MLNNKYQDGLKWHDVACHFRSVIVCEDSDQLIALVQQQNGVDVSQTVKKGEDSRLVDPDAVIAEEDRHDAEVARQVLKCVCFVNGGPIIHGLFTFLQIEAQRQRRPPFGFGFGPGGPGRPRPARRPQGGFLGALRRFPFLF